MTTFKRICIKNYDVSDGELVLTLERGKEYTTSKEMDGEVIVFTKVWGPAPVEIFAGAEPFTP